MVVPTNTGLIPYTTPDFSGDYPVYVFAGDFIDSNLAEPYLKSLAMDNHWTFVGPATADFFNFEDGPSKQGVRIALRNGSVKCLDSETYLKIVDKIHPQCYIPLYSQVPPGATKRQRKLREEATQMYSTESGGALAFSPVNSNSYGRFLTSTETIDGTGDKPVAVLIDGHPEEIRELYMKGCSVFIFNMPIHLAEKRIAATFEFDSQVDEMGIDLREKKYAHDHTPIVDGCDCFCCQHHTRSYLHHLITVHEMLADTLLVHHNLHHFKKFIDSLSKL